MHACEEGAAARDYERDTLRVSLAVAAAGALLLLVQYLNEDISLFCCSFIPISKHLFIHPTIGKHAAYRERRPEGSTTLRMTTMMTMMILRTMIMRYRDVMML